MYAENSGTTSRNTTNKVELMSSISGHLLELTDTESGIKYPGNKNANFTVYGKETVVNSLIVNGLSPAQLAVASEDEEIDTAALADSFETLHVEYEKVDANANTAIGDDTTSYTLKVNDKDVLVDGDIISGKGVIFEEREDNKIEVASYYNSSSEITETLENVYTTGNFWYYCTKFAAGRFDFDILKEVVIEHKNSRASLPFWVHVYQGDEKEYKGVSTNSNSFVVNVPKTFTFDNLHIDKNKDLYIAIAKHKEQYDWERLSEKTEASNNQIIALLVSDEGHEDTVAISAEEENIKTGASFVKSITGDSIKKVDLYEHATDSDIHVTPQLMQTWNEKQDALSDEQLITVNSGVTAEDKEKWDETTTIVNGKIVTNEEGLTETGYWANYFVVGGDNLISGSVKSIKVNYNFNEEKNIGGAANKYNETSWIHVFKTDKSTQIDASHDVTGSGVPSTWTLVAVSTNSVTPNNSNTGVWTFDNLTIDTNYKYIFALQSSEGNFNPNAMSKLAVLGFDDGTPDNKMRRYSDTARGAQFGTNLASMELYMATIRESLQDHIKDTNLHLTQADRDKLNSAVFSGTLTIANDRTSPQIFITSDTSEKNIYFDSNSTYTTGHTLQLNYANNKQNIIATADSFTYNGSNVLTESSAAFTTLQSAVSALEGSHFEVVDTLPATGKDNTIYLVPKAKSETSNVKDEYIYINSAWEKIGDTEIDLSKYLQKEEAEETYTSKTELSNEIAKCVSKSGDTMSGDLTIGNGGEITYPITKIELPDGWNTVNEDERVFMSISDMVSSSLPRVFINISDKESLSDVVNAINAKDWKLKFKPYAYIENGSLIVSTDTAAKWVDEYFYVTLYKSKSHILTYTVREKIGNYVHSSIPACGASTEYSLYVPFVDPWLKSFKLTQGEEILIDKTFEKGEYTSIIDLLEKDKSVPLDYVNVTGGRVDGYNLVFIAKEHGEHTNSWVISTVHKEGEDTEEFEDTIRLGELEQGRSGINPSTLDLTLNGQRVLTENSKEIILLDKQVKYSIEEQKNFVSKNGDDIDGNIIIGSGVDVKASCLITDVNPAVFELNVGDKRITLPPTNDMVASLIIPYYEEEDYKYTEKSIFTASFEFEGNKIIDNFTGTLSEIGDEISSKTTDFIALEIKRGFMINGYISGPSLNGAKLTITDEYGETLTRFTEGGSFKRKLHELVDEINANEDFNATAEISGSNDLIIRSKINGSEPNGTRVVSYYPRIETELGSLEKGFYEENKTNYTLKINGEDCVTKSELKEIKNEIINQEIQKEIEEIKTTLHFAEIEIKNNSAYECEKDTILLVPGKWENKIIKSTVLWNPPSDTSVSGHLYGATKITILGTEEPKAGYTTILEITQISPTKIHVTVIPNV